MKKGFIFYLICGIMVLGVSLDAKDKDKKEKSLPYGLEKKLERTGELPPGWEKKIKKGEVLEEDIMKHAKLLETSQYQNKNSEMYQIQDKIIRVIKGTNEILDVLK